MDFFGVSNSDSKLKFPFKIFDDFILCTLHYVNYDIYIASNRAAYETAKTDVNFCFHTF